MTYPQIEFQTFMHGRPRTCGVVLDIRDTVRAPERAEIGALCARSMHNPAATASGKIALLAADGIHVFQADARQSVRRVWCGNAVAAALAVEASAAARLEVHGPAGRRCTVESRCSGPSIQQTWTFEGSPRIIDREWRGLRVAIVGFLNRYAIVEGPLPDGVTPSEARLELVGASLDAKLAVVDPGRTDVVSFHNAAGEHGAAPLTGLATLGLARLRCSWLAMLLARGSIRHLEGGRRHTQALPRILTSPQGCLRIVMPGLEVALNVPGAEWEMAA
ncbi:MAG: hypothetical protein WC729_20375 [Sphingomonas sp.]|uniref:hypothetical protein n=1 Tax=Sphingomonas sp. TaxID=28214 RepID=UPI00356829B6